MKRGEILYESEVYEKKRSPGRVWKWTLAALLVLARRSSVCGSYKV